MEATRVSAETVEAAESTNEAGGLVAMSEAVVRGESPNCAPTEVIVRVDATTLTGDVDSCAILAGISRRLLCDAGIVPVLEDGFGNTLNIGRKSRSVPTAIKRALRLRDIGDGICRFPGCHHTRHLDARGQTRYSRHPSSPPWDGGA